MDTSSEERPTPGGVADAEAGDRERIDPQPRRDEYDVSGARTGEGSRLVPLGSAEVALALSMAGTPAAAALIERLGLSAQAADEGIRAASASSLAARGLAETTPAGRLAARGAALAVAHLGGGARRIVGLSRIEGERELGPCLLAIADGGVLILEPGPVRSFLVAAADGAGSAVTALERLVRLHIDGGEGRIAALESRALGGDSGRPDLDVAIRRADAEAIEVARAAAGGGSHRVASMPDERLRALLEALASA